MYLSSKKATRGCSVQASISDHVKALLGTSYPIVHVVDVQDTHAERAASEQSCGQPTGGWFAQPRCKEYSTFKLAGRGAIHKEVKTNHIDMQHSEKAQLAEGVYPAPTSGVRHSQDE